VYDNCIGIIDIPMAEDIVGNRYRVSFVDICAVSLFI